MHRSFLEGEGGKPSCRHQGPHSGQGRARWRPEGVVGTGTKEDTRQCTGSVAGRHTLGAGSGEPVAAGHHPGGLGPYPDYRPWSEMEGRRRGQMPDEALEWTTGARCCESFFTLRSEDEML